MANFNDMIIPYYSPISAKGGRKRKCKKHYSRRNKSRRNKRSNAHHSKNARTRRVYH